MTTSSYQGILDRLEEDEGLIDIASTASAYQSSLSRWSRTNGAGDVLKAGNTDFGFHTEDETDPWVVIDLEQEARLRYLIIENRKKIDYQSLASPLKVEVIDVDGASTEIYSGRMMFGAPPEQLPLILPLMGSQSAKKIKLTRLGKGYFHLSRVRVLCRPSDLGPRNFSGKTIILNNRTDGLGQRLWSMVNGLVLSALDESFQFMSTWPVRSGISSQHHSIVPEDQFFSPKFIEQFSASDLMLTPEKRMSNEEFRSSSDPIREIKKYKIIQSDPEDISSFLPGLKDKIPEHAFKEAYDKIHFSDRFNKAKRLAEEMPLGGEPVAIHLRAGDIIYGQFRLVDRFVGKVAPFPLIDALLSSLSQSGADIYLFGQDGELCKFFAEKYGATYADDISRSQELDEFAGAIFEITLMSRMARIFSGSSGFSLFASVIGNVPLKDFRGIFDKRDVEGIIESRVDVRDSRVSDLQKAFAYRYACVVGGNFVPTEKRILLMRRALSLDPDNGFYRLVLISYLAEAGFLREADDMASGLKVEKARNSIFSAITHSHPDGRMDAEKYVKPIAKEAAPDTANLAAIAALFFWARGEQSKVTPLFDILETASASTHAYAKFVRDAMSSTGSSAVSV